MLTHGNTGSALTLYISLNHGIDGIENKGGTLTGGIHPPKTPRMGSLRSLLVKTHEVLRKQHHGGSNMGHLTGNLSRI